MRNPLESLIKRLGSMYSIERDNSSVDPVKGLINQEQSTVIVSMLLTKKLQHFKANHTNYAVL